MRSTVNRALKPLDAVAVENPVGPGTPDVNHNHGWIELKWLRAWPRREATPVVIDHYTPQQRVWALRRRHRGGMVHLLLQCRREWILLDGAWAARHLGTSTRAQLIEGAERVWLRGLNGEELCEWLRSECPQGRS